MDGLIPMLLDILNGALFVGGCFVLWLNFRRVRRDVLSVPRLVLTEKERAKVEPESRFENSAGPEPHEAAHTTLLEQSDNDDTEDTAAQNSYAARVALAMKNARTQR